MRSKNFAKLDCYDLLILDDIAYVTKDTDETSVLFERSGPVAGAVPRASRRAAMQAT